MRQQHRSLTEAEIGLARTVFADAIDYARVRICTGAWWLRGETAVAPNGHIYFPRSAWQADFAQASAGAQMWLIHELTHVWQHQLGYSVARAGVALFLRGGYRARRAYDYGFGCDQMPDFASLNMEQQADMLAHYYAAAVLGLPKYQAQLPLLQAALKDFLRYPTWLALLPNHSRCPAVTAA